MLEKIDSVLNHKGILLLHELVGANERHLTQCVREVKEKSSMFRKGWKMDSKKPTKGSRKVWEEFV